MSGNKLSEIMPYVFILLGIILLIPRIMIWMAPSFPTGSSAGPIEAIMLFFNPAEPTGVLALIGILVIIVGILLSILQKIEDHRAQSA